MIENILPDKDTITGIILGMIWGFLMGIAFMYDWKKRKIR